MALKTLKSDKALVVFEDKKIRRIWHNDEWYYSIIDVIEALTDSSNPRNYWSMLKKRETEHKIELSTFCVQLKLLSTDGKFYTTDCANTESIFRIVQSIPSRKAEPFKRWLAKVGYQRVQEIENPELAQKRMKEIYRAKGYSDARNTATTVFLHINEVVSSFIVIGLKNVFVGLQ